MIRTHELAKKAIGRRLRLQARFYGRGTQDGFHVRDRQLVWVFETACGSRITEFRHQWQRLTVVLETTGFDNHRV